MGVKDSQTYAILIPMIMTPRQKQAMDASPDYREFIESGDSMKAARLISMAYLLSSISNAYFEESVELMEKHNLVHKKIKTTSNNLTQSFDAFDKCVSQLIDTKEAKNHLCNDYDYFRSVCDKFMNLNEEKGETK